MKIKYELGPIRKDKTYHVRITVTNGTGTGNRRSISTNIYVPKKDVTVNTNANGRQKVRIKNGEILDKINRYIIDVTEELRHNIVTKNVETKYIANIIKGEDGFLPTFFDYTQMWIKRCDLKGKKNYITAINVFMDYVKNPKLRFSDITYHVLYGFSEYLGDRERAKSLYLGALRHIWNEADKEFDDRMPRSPFKKFSVPRQRLKGQRAIDITTLKKIYNYSGTGRAKLARDCFLLSFCLAGINSVDLFNCDTVVNNTLIYNRTKTRDRRIDSARMELEINEEIKNIVDEYRDTTGQRVFRFHQMYTSYGRFSIAINVGLKTILGADSGVTFYSARHTWATIARNELGASKSDVNDALVHVDRGMDVTDIYIKKDYRQINKLNSRVIKYTLSKLRKES